MTPADQPQRPESREPTTVAGDNLLTDIIQDHEGPSYHVIERIRWGILAIESEARAAEHTESRPSIAAMVAALRQAPTIHYMVNRGGRFNDVWWERFAGEVLAGLTADPRPAGLDVAPWLRAEIEMMHWGTVGDEHPDRGKSLVLRDTVLLVIDAALAALAADPPAPVPHPDPALAYAPDGSVVGRVIGWATKPDGRSVPILGPTPEPEPPAQEAGG